MVGQDRRSAWPPSTGTSPKAKALIVRQEILVARLAAVGGDVARARQALEEMRQSLREMYRTRRLILEGPSTP